MTRLVTERLRFDDWTLGNYGTHGPYEGARLGYKYNAKNLQVYDGGALGVRPGLRKLGWTGLANAATSTATGRIVNMLWVGQTHASDNQQYGWFVWAQANASHNAKTVYNNQDVWYGPLDSVSGAATLHGGALFSNSILQVDWNESINVTDTTVNLRTGGTATKTLNPVAYLTLYRNRLYGLGTNGNVDFSAEGVWDDFTANEFFNVKETTEWKASGLATVLDSLFIWTPEGDWFSLQGTNPNANSLRRFGTAARRPADWATTHGPNYTITSEGLYFATLNPRDGLTFTDGTRIEAKAFDHLRHSENPTPENIRNASDWPDPQYQFNFGGGAWVPARSGIVVPQTVPVSAAIEGSGDTEQYVFRSLERVNNVWTMAEYAESGVNVLSGRVCRFADDKIGVAMMEDKTDPSLYTRDLSLNRPAHTNDDWSDYQETIPAGTAQSVQGLLELVDIIPENGELSRVATVTIDFTYWKHATDTYATVNLDCIVRQKGIQSTDGSLAEKETTIGSIDTTETAAEYDPDQWDNITDHRGLRRQLSFQTVDLEFAAANQIVLSAVQSLAIHSVVVDVEYEAAEMK